MNRTALGLPRQLSRRTKPFPALSRHYSSAFNTGPAPPRLPKEEQEVFEQLQRQSTGAFSTPRATPQINQSPDSTPASSATSTDVRAKINQSPDSAAESGAVVDTQGVTINVEGEEVHPHMRRGAPPEFEGDVNPKTGEVGGPKNEPLRWGESGDWSYNGRVTDF
ncbi:DUF1674-domain-containing protein [Polyplosphaeria fusca]|uniref:Succinate dehydrogenase assembly factor 4, mitochondrial n=1 Tax=Polyplosphaeria fusca TaxID=682080 RepID=A0A9P4V0H1_9PLEO|nr:DUF1674-domain-containing protein [Polyplosphaeria fusca]